LIGIGAYGGGHVGVLSPTTKIDDGVRSDEPQEDGDLADDGYREGMDAPRGSGELGGGLRPSEVTRA
jgi:hypothetical protein